MRSVSILNRALGSSLDVITQNFLHAALLRAAEHAWASSYYEHWVQTMVRCDALLVALLEAGGRPASRAAGQLTFETSPQALLTADLDLGERWLVRLEACLADCHAAKDAEAAAIIQDLLTGERATQAWRTSLQADGKESASLLPGDGKSIEVPVLQDLLATSLSAITQVYYHGQLLEGWHCDAQAKFMADETWGKTWRSLALAQQMFVNGMVPRADGHGAVKVGSSAEEALDLDAELVERLSLQLEQALSTPEARESEDLQQVLVQAQAAEAAHGDWLSAQRGAATNG